MDFELGYTLRTVLLGAAILGAVGGVLGSFATLRRQSLVGDALAHAALPGVCLAFLWTGLREPLPLMVGASLTGLAGALALLAIVRGSRIKEDAALGIVLSVSFGFGTLLLTRIQHQGDAAQSGLDRFLFGQAATLLERDVATMAVLAAIVLSIVWLFFKELKLLTFDAEFAAAAGFPTTALSIGLTALLVAAVAIGLQAVGVILMVALLIAPAVAARQWTRSLGTMTAVAAGIGAVSGVVGTLLSAGAANVPTGPAIVLVATAFATVSVLLAPERGVVWRARRQAALAAGAGDAS
jgi:manganese/zinc/iron transport system permease protein